MTLRLTILTATLLLAGCAKRGAYRPAAHIQTPAQVDKEAEIERLERVEPPPHRRDDR